jgi:DNA-binding transcriptional MerR regulator
MIKGGQIMRRLDMLKTREVLRLRHELGLSLREIGQVCSCGKTTVSEILMRAKRAEIVWPIDLSDKQLMSRLYPPAETRTSVHEPDMEYLFHEMKKKKVTFANFNRKVHHISLQKCTTICKKINSI